MTSSSLRLGVLASGRGTDLQSLIDAGTSGKLQSRVVVVASDVAGAPALDRARKHSIPAGVVSPDDGLKGTERRADHDQRLIALLKEHQVDVVVLAGYMRLVSPSFLAAFPQRVINIHPALLPAFPGLHAQSQALAAGARVTGCTTHLVDELVDHGPILLQAAVTIGPDETEESLSRRILEVEHQLLPRTIQLWESGRIRIQAGRARIDPDESWTKRFPTLPGVLYGPGY